MLVPEPKPPAIPNNSAIASLTLLLLAGFVSSNNTNLFFSPAGELRSPQREAEL